MNLSGCDRALPPGPSRANLDAHTRFTGCCPTAEAVGDDVGAFETLQCERGRRLAESLTAASGDQEPYQPPGDRSQEPRRPGRAESGACRPHGEPEGVQVRILTADGLQSFDVTQPPLTLSTAWRAMCGDVRQRAVDALRIVSESPLFADIAQRSSPGLIPGRRSC